MIGFLGDSKASALVWKIIMAVACFAFVVSGGIMYGVGGGSSAYLVKVGDTEIGSQDFQQAYNQKQKQLHEIYGNKFQSNPEIENKLRESTLQEMINYAVLAEYRKRLNLKISDLEVKHVIVNIPTFQKNGRFDNQLYLKTLQAANMLPDDYASVIKHNLEEKKLTDVFMMNNFIVPAQVNDLGKILAKKRHVAIAEQDIQPLIAQQTATNDEITKYYQDNQVQFTLPVRVKIQYLDLNKNNFKSSVNDQDLQTYYEKNKDKFTEPAKQHLAMISLAEQDKAQQLYTALQKGEDFAKLAKENSDDSASATKDGDIGWLATGSFPKEIEEKINKLDINKVSEPINLNKKFILIKVLAREDAKVKSFADSKDQVQDLFVTDKFYQAAKTVSELAEKDRSSLTKIAQTVGLAIQETPLFDQTSVPVAIQNEQIVNSIFDAENIKSKNVSDFISIDNDRAFIYQITKNIPAQVQPLEQVKAKISEQIKLNKALVLVNKQAKELIVALNKNGDVALDKAQLQFTQEQDFSYFNTEKSKLSEVALDMTLTKDNKPSYSYVIDQNKLFVLKLTKIDSNPQTDEQHNRATEDISNLDNSLLQTSIMTALHQATKIELNEILWKSILQNNEY